MPNTDARYTADFMRAIGSDLRGVEILSVNLPKGYRDPGMKKKPLDMAITRHFDTDSPALFKLYTSGELVPKVVIEMVGDAKQRYTITFSDVEVVEVSHLPDGSDAIKLSYTGADGELPADRNAGGAVWIGGLTPPRGH